MNDHQVNHFKKKSSSSSCSLVEIEHKIADFLDSFYLQTAEQAALSGASHHVTTLPLLIPMARNETTRQQRQPLGARHSSPSSFNKSCLLIPDLKKNTNDSRKPPKLLLSGAASGEVSPPAPLPPSADSSDVLGSAAAVSAANEATTESLDSCKSKSEGDLPDKSALHFEKRLVSRTDSNHRSRTLSCSSLLNDDQQREIKLKQHPTTNSKEFEISFVVARSPSSSSSCSLFSFNGLNQQQENEDSFSMRPFFGSSSSSSSSTFSLNSSYSSFSTFVNNNNERQTNITEEQQTSLENKKKSSSTLAKRLKLLVNEFSFDGSMEEKQVSGEAEDEDSTTLVCSSAMAWEPIFQDLPVDSDFNLKGAYSRQKNF